MKTALVTGAFGQDGSYIAEILAAKGYHVTLLVRPSGNSRVKLIEEMRFKHTLLYGDITDPHLIVRLAQQKFDEMYLLAGQTHVMQSFQDPTYTLRVNAESPIAFFDAVQRFSKDTRIYFAGTSEMFAGQAPGTKAGLGQPFEPHSPYAVAKVAAFTAARMYRKLGVYIVGGISYNHESCRRGAHFVTRKIGLGLQEWKISGKKLVLGNGTAFRDWHHAKDTMEGAWLSLQQASPREYVFASGVARSVKEFAMDMVAFLNIGTPEKAITFSPDEEVRPWEVPYLCGDPAVAEEVLGWKRAIDYQALLADVSRREF